MRTAVDGAVKPPAEETPADKTGKEDDEREEQGQDKNIARQRQGPEAEQREQGEEYDDIDADEAVDHRVGEQLPLIEHIADDERQDQIGDEKNQTGHHFVHGDTRLSCYGWERIHRAVL